MENITTRTTIDFESENKDFAIANTRGMRLAQDTPEAYYWIGFLLADGHFSKDGRITLGLQGKDVEQLVKFGKFVGAENVSKIKNQNYFTVRFSNKIIVDYLKKQLDINNQKTYHPPNLSVFQNMDDDLFVSMFCGYVCGDGCIRKLSKNRKHINNSMIAVKCHLSWEPILKYFTQRLCLVFNEKCRQKNFRVKHYRYEKSMKTNVDYFALMNISRHTLLKKIKNFAINNNLPILDRKWINIDITNNHCVDIRNRITNNIKHLIVMGKNRKEIAAILSLSVKRVNSRIRNRKLLEIIKKNYSCSQILKN